MRSKWIVVALVGLLVVGSGIFVVMSNLSFEPARNRDFAESVPAPEVGSETTPVFSHALLGQLLEIYVDKDGWVDYAGLGADRSRLNEYLSSLDGADPASFPSDADRFAFWVNAYNAFTLADVLDDVYGGASSVRDVPGFFDKKQHRIAGRSLTLDEIESQARALGDPRVHFVVVCASTSCPKLQRFAYDGLLLEEQLSRVTAEFLSDPERGVRVEPERRRIIVSPIFKWYAGDFTGATNDTARALARTRAEVSADFAVAYIRANAPREVTSRIDGFEPSVVYLEYDWTLNAKSRPGEASSQSR